MPLSRKRTRLYAKGLLAAIERYPKKTDSLLKAFIEMLQENRHLRYCQSILTAIADVLEERGGVVRIKAESTYPLSSKSLSAIERFFRSLPAVTQELATTGANPGIHLRTATYHWDGRISTALQQLREQLTS